MPIIDPEFTARLQAINEQYNPENPDIDMGVFNSWDSTQGDDRSRYYAAMRAANPDKPNADEAEQQVRDLLAEYDYTDAASLRTSVRGSHNDTYVNLGAAGNRIYNTGAYNPQGGGSRDVDTSGFADAPIGSSSLMESGSDPSIFASKGFQIGASLLAPFTGGLSVAAQQALVAADGDTLHGDDYARAAVAVATPALNNAFANGVGDFGGWGPGIQTGAATGASTAALEGAITGDFNLGDVAQGGLLGGAAAGAKDYLLDTLQTGSRQGLWDEAVAKGITGEGDIREYIARNLNSSDFGKAFGNDSIFGGSELNTEWLNTGINAIGRGAEAIGADKLLNPLFNTFGNAYTGNKAFQESKAAVDDAQARLHDATPSTREARTAELNDALDTHRVTFEGIQEDQIRYDERFLTDADDERGDSPLFGITRENPYGAGVNPDASGEGAADATLPSVDTNTTPITDAILGVVEAGTGEGTQAGTGGGPADNTQLPQQNPDQVLQDQIREAIAAEEDPTVRQGMQEDLAALEGDDDLMGTQDPFEDLQGSGVGEGNLTLGGYDQDLPASVAGDENLPPAGNENLPPSGDQNVPASDENLPGGTDVLPGPARRRKQSEAYDNELFRLARVMQVLPLSQLQKVSLQQRMREIQGNKAALAYDATATLDPQSTEYIQRVKKGQEEASELIDPIQQAIEATA